MKKHLFKMASLALALSFTGCSTIYFHSHQTNDHVSTYGHWHHDGVFGLVEFSDAEDMTKFCRGGTWKTIETKQSFLQGLAGGLTWRLYDPWNFSYSCVATAAAKPKK